MKALLTRPCWDNGSVSLSEKCMVFMPAFRLVAFAGLLLVVCPLEVVAQSVTDARKPTDEASCPCLRSEVRFDVSSVEKIILNPEAILAAPDRFWEEDKAYQHLLQWHNRISQPPDREKWRRGLEKLRDLSALERQQHPQLIAARNLAAIEESFIAKAIPYLCGFLPPEADLSTTIYFTTEMISAGFEAGGNIVVHILNHEVRNLFVHELFHRGMASLQPSDEDRLREMSMPDPMYRTLHDEGYATYVGYAGRDEFPQVGKIGSSLVAGDYAMLDKPEDISRLHSELGKMFRTASSTDPDSLRSLSWELGVNQRAYYVVGAFMAKTIDETLGRQALLATRKKGPRSFLEIYNALVDDRWKIPEIR